MIRRLQELCTAIRMPEPVSEEILAIAPRLDLEALRPMLEGLFRQQQWEEALEQLQKALGDDPRGMKMLTAMLLCTLKTREAYARQGIADPIFLATMDCFPRFVKEHMVSYGTYGFDREFWTVRQISGVLFRVGLLEFELREKDVSLHIPTGARLDPEAVTASLEAGKAFLSRHFPDWAEKPMTCHSWLLSPTLQELLPPDSGIRKFQDRFRVTPQEEENRDFIMWVFKHDDLPLEQLPEDTSLQRILKAHLLAGKPFVDARGVLK